MKERKQKTEEAEAGLKIAPRYQPQAAEWTEVEVCCENMRRDIRKGS